MIKGFRRTTALFRLMVLFVFFMISSLLVAVSVNTYARVQAGMEANANLRTASGFIANKERAFSEELSVEDQVLRLSQEIDGARYFSYIYYDGVYLREAFLPEDYPFSPEDGGEIITELDDFRINLQDGNAHIVMQRADAMLERVIEVR